MARGPAKATEVAPKKVLSPDQIERGIQRLQQRIEDIDKFDISLVRSDNNPPELKALATAIERTLASVFGDNTADYHRYKNSADVIANFAWATNGYPARQHYVEQIREKLPAARHMLQEAINALKDELLDIESNVSAIDFASPAQNSLSRSVFLVHGREEGPREAVARFLERLDFEVIILHEQANQNRTVIEKIEGYSDVGFAVILLTPDDEGNLKGEETQPRARQNVLLELGYFIGKLTRSRVCTLKVGELEIPSDWRGVINEPFDSGGAWKQTLARELDAVGYQIDWNKVMR